MPRLPVQDLHDLAVALDAGFAADDWSSPPLLLGIVSMDADGGGVLAVLEADPGAPTDHPADMLRRLRVPGDWAGLGVVAHGWGVPLDDRTSSGPAGSRPSPLRPSERAERVRVRVVDLIDRSGRGVALLHRRGHSATVIEADAAESAGAVPDAMRRALGLPTASCRVSTLELYAVLWLEAVVGLTGTSRRRTIGSWSRVALAHPALALLRGDGNDRRDLPFLVEMARSLAAVGDWAYLRRAVSDGQYPWLSVDPGAARWMDDGMFGRTVVSGSPSLEAVRAEVAAVVAGPILQQIDAALDAWGLFPPGSQSFKTSRPTADEDDGLGCEEPKTTGAADAAGEAATGCVR